jgi:hypothetical protein
LEAGLSNRCFVIQKFDVRYNRLFDEIFDSAIGKADLQPYRVDRDPGASIPIETIEQEISDSLACFAELSEDNPNVWFELGYAIARNKPLCLVCSEKREKFPFDVQHRQIIKYPPDALPKDYEQLQEKITKRLQAAVSQRESLEINAAAATALAIQPDTDGLQPHELLALTIVFQNQYDEGIGARALADDMKRGGYIQAAASLAIARLNKLGFLRHQTVGWEDGSSAERIFVSGTGEEWLLSNQHKLNLRLPGKGPEVRDEDIPF